MYSSLSCLSSVFSICSWSLLSWTSLSFLSLDHLLLLGGHVVQFRDLVLDSRSDHWKKWIVLVGHDLLLQSDQGRFEHWVLEGIQILLKSPVDFGESFVHDVVHQSSLVRLLHLLGGLQDLESSSLYMVLQVQLLDGEELVRSRLLC